MQHFSLVLGVEGHSCLVSGKYLKLRVTWTNSFLCIYESIEELFKNITTIEKIPNRLNCLPKWRGKVVHTTTFTYTEVSSNIALV